MQIQLTSEEILEAIKPYLQSKFVAEIKELGVTGEDCVTFFITLGSAKAKTTEFKSEPEVKEKPSKSPYKEKPHLSKELKEQAIKIMDLMIENPDNINRDKIEPLMNGISDELFAYVSLTKAYDHWRSRSGAHYDPETRTFGEYIPFEPDPNLVPISQLPGSELILPTLLAQAAEENKKKECQIDPEILKLTKPLVFDDPKPEPKKEFPPTVPIDPNAVVETKTILGNPVATNSEPVNKAGSLFSSNNNNRTLERLFG